MRYLIIYDRKHAMSNKKFITHSTDYSMISLDVKYAFSTMYFSTM